MIGQEHHLSRSYTTLRMSGCPSARAAVELGLRDSIHADLETRFQSNALGGDQQPKFAKHVPHVLAIRAVSPEGYPVLHR